jgi:hypothetical protein
VMLVCVVMGFVVVRRRFHCISPVDSGIYL